MIIKKSNQKFKQKNQTNNPSEQNGLDSNADGYDSVSAENTAETTSSETQEPAINLFDVENIDFKQRQERRRGSRRRGYRRIDDRNLVSRAQEESENIKKSAFEEGYRMGLERSSEDLARFREEFVKFMSARKEVFEYIAPDIMEISVNIARKIIKKELESDPQIIINTITDVLKTVSKSEPKVIIRVKPQAVEFIKDILPNVTYQYGIESKVNIVADPAIEEGGCVFQTNNGIVDASIDTQLEIIKKALDEG